MTAIGMGTASVAVLIVSRAPSDHHTLRSILNGSKWSLYAAHDVPAALRHLRRHRDISLLVCDRESWKEMLASISEIPRAPVMIVAATHADDHLWAEALNLGAYDVLAKPFDTTEVVRSLSLGWMHWRRRHEPAAVGQKPVAAAAS